MIHPEHDRINYPNLLLPPPDYEFVQAICTTYSLDLEALLSVSMCLGYSIDVQEDDKDNKVLLYKALHDVADKLVIFHEAGQIAFHNINTSFYLLLEKMLVPIQLPKKNNYYPAFHPKFWILKYKTIKNNTVEYLYRLIILSRNLTFDKSWDISIAFDGIHVETINKKSSELSLYLEYIGAQASYMSENNETILESFISELKQVDFQISHSIAQDFDFIPLYGSNRGIIKELINAQRVDDIFVMSPFITKDIINVLAGKPKTQSNATPYENVLITRRESLCELVELDNIDKINTFVVINNEDEENDAVELEKYEDDKEFILNDIHAKIFLIQDSQNVYMYLGSMNATRAAVYDNVEMMIKLKLNNRTLDSYVRDIMDLVYKDKKLISTYFEKATIPEKQEKNSDDDDIIKTIIKTVCRMSLSGTVKKQDEKFFISIENKTISGEHLIHKNFSNYEIEISPIMLNNPKPFFKEPTDNSSIIFIFDSITYISNFFILYIKDRITKQDYKSILQIGLVWDDNLEDNRETELLKILFSNKTYLLNYIDLLLSETSTEAYYYLQDKKRNPVYNGKQESSSLAIYEKMLRASVEKPELINEFSELLTKIGTDNEISKELYSLIYLFQNTEGQNNEL